MTEEERIREVEMWIEGRPPEVRDLLKSIPFAKNLCHFDRDGEVHYVMGASDSDVEPVFVVSDVNPTEDYDAAFANRFSLCRHETEWLVEEYQSKGTTQ